MVFRYIPNKICSGSEMASKTILFSYIYFCEEAFFGLSERCVLDVGTNPQEDHSTLEFPQNTFVS